ncbi:MAG: META domain-containing protein [Paracoccus sp. (in: a-proteobacteria)]|nr:META domain-containing protein [Paracoccus sp. (in: a-proteobacteria)]
MRLILAACLATLAACAPDAPPEAERIDGIDWKLMAVGGAAYGFDVSLRLDGGRLSGIAPCNVYAARRAGAAPDFAASHITATEMACAEPARQRAESDYLTALGRADRIAREGAGLVLTGPGGLRLDFAPREARGDEVF